MPDGVTVRFRSHWALSDSVGVSDVKTWVEITPFWWCGLIVKLLQKKVRVLNCFEEFTLSERYHYFNQTTFNKVSNYCPNYYYHPPTKLREGHVFGNVQDSVRGRTVTLSPSLHVGQTLAPFSGLSRQGPLPDMFKLVQIESCCTSPPTDSYKYVHYETRTVRKRAIGIRLKCLLVTDRKGRYCFHRHLLLCS